MELNAIRHKLIKPDPSPGQQIKRLIGNSLLILVPLEVELPCVDWVRHVALFIRNRQTDLDHLSLFDVAADENVLLVLLAVASLAILPAAGGNYAGELGVLCEIK